MTTYKLPTIYIEGNLLLVSKNPLDSVLTVDSVHVIIETVPNRDKVLSQLHMEVIKMNEMKDELYAVPEDEWQQVPITVNRHKWWLRWYRFGDEGNFFFCFESPRTRSYSFWTEHGKNGGRVTDADVTLANGVMIASYCESWGDSPAKMDAVLRLTPKHILDRLFVLLDAIG